MTGPTTKYEGVRLTVARLREMLAEYDPETPVYLKGYEGGVDDVEELTLVSVKRDQHEAWYFGPHERVDDDSGEDGLLLMGFRG